MRDYSVPPYDLFEIGQEVKRLGNLLNIRCNLAHNSHLRESGFFTLPTLSEDIARIANAHGLQMSITGDLEQTGKQLQELIAFLENRGISLA